jgi:hypothetical protein
MCDRLLTEVFEGLMLPADRHMLIGRLVVAERELADRIARVRELIDELVGLDSCGYPISPPPPGRGEK